MPSARDRRLILWSGLGVVGVAGALSGAWILSLPATPTVSESRPFAREKQTPFSTARQIAGASVKALINVLESSSSEVGA